jgi:cytochrome P450
MHDTAVTFDITRADKPTRGFCSGRHRWLGPALTSLEAMGAPSALFECFPEAHTDRSARGVKACKHVRLQWDREGPAADGLNRLTEGNADAARRWFRTDLQPA